MRTPFKAASLLGLALAANPASAFSIFACEPEWAGLAQQLAPQASVFSATHAYQDPHYIEARPSLISKLRGADLAICSGAELEAGWLPALQQRAANPKVHTGRPGLLFAAEQVETVDKTEAGFFDTAHVHPEGNPHLHLDPERLALVAQSLSQRLIDLDPENAQTYQRAQGSWEESWQQNIERWRTQAAPLKGERVLAQHTTFDYLWRWLGIEVIADLEPKPGVPPTTAHLASLIDKVEEEAPLAIVHAWYQAPQSAEWLGEKTATPVLSLPSTLPPEQQIERPEQLFDHLISALLELQGER